MSASEETAHVNTQHTRAERRTARDQLPQKSPPHDLVCGESIAAQHVFQGSSTSHHFNPWKQDGYVISSFQAKHAHWQHHRVWKGWELQYVTLHEQCAMRWSNVPMIWQGVFNTICSSKHVLCLGKRDHDHCYIITLLLVNITLKMAEQKPAPLGTGPFIIMSFVFLNQLTRRVLSQQCCCQTSTFQVLQVRCPSSKLLDHVYRLWNLWHSACSYETSMATAQKSLSDDEASPWLSADTVQSWLRIPQRMAALTNKQKNTWMLCQQKP